jgi:hypothetical protein
MSATEPLTHVKVHGRHFFIPRSLTEAPLRCTNDDGNDNFEEIPFAIDATLSQRCDDRPSESDLPTAEEHRVLHELLTAVVLSATCRCGGLAELIDSTDYSDDSEGVTNLPSRRTPSAATAAEMGDLPLTSSSTPTFTKLPVAPEQLPTSSPAHRCANAPTVACAVVVILLSCALLRSTCD